MPLNATPSRQGTLLALAFFVIALVASLLLITSDEVFGVHKLQVLGRAKQKATYAAESIAAIREADIVALAAQNDLLALDTRPNPNSGTQWFNDCVVRWRVEPVRLTSTDAGGAENAYTVNPLANPGVDPPGSYRGNNSFYTYRIATEAWSLRDPSVPNQQPWATPGLAVARVRASRVVVVNLVSLFRYAIFYAAPSPVGDLEMWAGSSITVNGSVHSNGAIFIGGGSAAYANPPIGSNRYNASASGNGGVVIGTAANRVPIVGVAGLFRMRKGANLVAATNGVTGASANPMLVPRVGDPGCGSGELNLNGDTPTDTRHRFNNVAFTSADDSRSSTMQSRWAGFVRDGITGGARIVRTLSNIPELAGRPFEANRGAALGQPLYTTGTDPNDRTSITSDGNDPGARQLYYTGALPATLTADPAAGLGGPAYASELPLFHQGGTRMEVCQPATEAQLLDGDPDSSAPAANDTFLIKSAYAAPGAYLVKALVGTDGLRTGLTIRERGAVNSAWRWTDSAGVSRATPALRPAPLAAGATAAQITDFVRSSIAWMKSQYVVTYQAGDITDRFFSFNEAAAIAANDLTLLTATSDDILNRRESFFLQQRGYLPGPLNSTTSARFNEFRINVLTLRWANIESFLKTTLRSTLQPGWGGGDLANSGFNGLIYAQRTPRLRAGAGVYRFHPLAPFGYDALTGSQRTADQLQTTFAATTFLATEPARPNLFDAVRLYDPIAGATAIGTGAYTIPFLNAIRVTQAGSINHGVMNPLNPARLLGLTIATPNHCYLQGDYNTTRFSGTTASGAGELPPCALFADGLTALSNAWQDGQNQRYADALRTAATTTFNLSLIINNVPTTDANAPFEGSGAVANVVKFLESWSGRTYNFTGSLVVMNQARYTRGDLGANVGAPAARSFYSPPARVLNFNTDLLTGSGQPPFTPFGVNVVRAISTVHVVE